MVGSTRHVKMWWFFKSNMYKKGLVYKVGYLIWGPFRLPCKTDKKEYEILPESLDKWFE